MTDTVRTSAYLTGTSFPTGKSGGILAQDIRDLVVSVPNLAYATPALIKHKYVDMIDYLPAGLTSLDGTYHPLSSYYGSLAAAQVDFPFATALTQTAEYCAVKAAS